MLRKDAVVFTFLRCSEQLLQSLVTASYFTLQAGLKLLQEVSYLNLEKYKEESSLVGAVMT